MQFERMGWTQGKNKAGNITQKQEVNGVKAVITLYEDGRDFKYKSVCKVTKGGKTTQKSDFFSTPIGASSARTLFTMFANDILKN